MYQNLYILFLVVCMQQVAGPVALDKAAAISVLAVTRCSEYEKKVSLWVKKKLDNDLHDNTK